MSASDIFRPPEAEGERQSAAGVAAGSDSQSWGADGPSFPWVVKGLATALLLALGYWSWRVSGSLPELADFLGGYGFALVTCGAVLFCYGVVMRSRTAIDPYAITQSWLWHKRVAWTEVTHAKLFRVAGLDWLIAPRLMLRVKGRGVYVFHVADSQVLRCVQAMGLGKHLPPA